ncbi:MAG: RtcB family protein [Candidatus Aenigmarchaeota archaeon]|nr:RtcB family protein [Candidatus Aenigmarchaeota archaeon]
MDLNKLKKIKDFEWEIPKSGEMRVPGRIFASEKLIREMDDKVWEQTSNVACLPGIQKASLAMPDAHWGYGFPIGGVAAFDPDEGGVVSVGGVGFDVNCGVTTLKTNLSLNDIKPKIKQVVEALFQSVPAGLGRRGEISLSRSQINELLIEGAPWVVKQGYGTKEDLDYIEENGRVDNAKPENVSDLAIKRETNQVGTLGSGNHYLEVQYIDQIYDEAIAKKFGLEMNQILVSIHCGSRALGHQICTDYLKTLADASRKYNIPIRERELVCAPINSPEGQKYFSAVNCAINYAFANRQVICHLTRNAFKKVFPDTDLPLLYNIGHNTVKIEQHIVDGKTKKLYVHRKGATRAFGPNREELPKPYQGVGQPVIIGGTMGTSSYILVGTEYGDEKSFSSVCHGAGRTMSRIQAMKTWRGEKLIQELANRGIIIKTHSFPGLAEEAPGAYKPVEDVVDSVHNAGLAKKVVRMLPLGCIKG